MSKPEQPPGESGGRRKVGTDKGSPRAGRGGVDRPIRGDEVIFRSANGRPVGNGGQDSPRASRLRIIADIVTGKHRRNG